MIKPPNDRMQPDGATAAAIGLLAMCLVTFDHEALGHGSVCLALHGHIRLLTSSLFRCDVRSTWIDPAGPAGNLLMGMLALIAQGFVPNRNAALRLFLIAVTAFSYFWEAGYLIHAMHERDGDLYFFAQTLFGDVTPGERWAGAAVGVLLYVLTVWLTATALARLWPRASGARAVARIVWLGASLGAGTAALLYRGPGWGDLRDALLEISASSFPLLFIPVRNGDLDQPPAALPRNAALIAASLAVFAVFAGTMGRGLGTPL
jgi:hypothetical protein